MAYYLVEADLKDNLKDELKQKLINNEFKHLNPFGKALTYSLENVKKNDKGKILWEEEDYCSPPLKEEKEAVLNKYFENIKVKKVNKSAGQEKIKNLPELFKDI